MTDTAEAPRSDRRTPLWAWFVAWFLLGVGYVVAVLGALTIGVFVLPVAVVATVTVATRRDATEGIPGLISGFALPLFYVAYLNRDGPGTVCKVLRDGGRGCSEQWSPWPWIGAGVALLLAGVVVFGNRRRSSRGAARRPA